LGGRSEALVDLEWSGRRTGSHSSWTFRLPEPRLTPYRYLDRFCRVARDRKLSPQALSVVALLCAEPLMWRHGYDIARQIGLKSGTLYPILIRLTDRGWLEACWEDEQPAGRPRRHLYRLTSEGLALGGEALAEMPAEARTAGKPRRAVGQIAPGGT
jgi:PadR family transcriptional regulator, regulatory protein PadR